MIAAVGGINIFCELFDITINRDAPFPDIAGIPDFFNFQAHDMPWYDIFLLQKSKYGFFSMTH